MKAISESRKKSEKKIESDFESKTEDDLAKLFNCFKKYMKSKQAKWKSSKFAKKDSGKETKCFECQGYGDYANECANKKKGIKKKALNTTWDEESFEEEQEEEKDLEADPSGNVNGKFVAFLAKSLTNNEIDDDQDDEMSGQEKDYEELYHTTYANCVRMTKYRNKITIKFKAAQEENSALKTELEQAMKKIHLLESQKKCIAENLTTDGQKLEKAEKEIMNLKKEIVMVKAGNHNLQERLKITLSELEVNQASLNKMNTGSKFLTNILGSQKSHFDISGLGYDHSASSSNAKGKTIFVSSVAHATPRTALSYNVLSSTKKKSVSQVDRTSTCHHCGKKGHSRPHYTKLKSLPKTK